jgi:hypothetical protein
VCGRPIIDWVTMQAGAPGVLLETDAPESVFQREPAPHLDRGVDTGSREENASKQETEPRSDSIGTKKALLMRMTQMRF